MRKEPILATALIRYPGYARRVRLNVRGGLHYIRGNAAPRFTITADILVSGHVIACGCLHDEILKHFPRFSDLVALHLSTIDGVPMHAETNGRYHLEHSERSVFDRHMMFAPEDVSTLVDFMRPIWKARADACIRHHHLRTFGDDYAATTYADRLLEERGYDAYGQA